MRPSNLISRALLALHVLTCAFLALPAQAVAQIAASDQPGVQVTFLDVGQGDAVLIRSPEGQTALIDAGTSAPLEALRAWGIERIDLLVATHPHADHIGGLADVLEALPVRFFMDNGQPYTTATYRRLMQTLERRTDVTYLAAEPRTLTLGSVELEVLALPPGDAENLNNRSVALVLRFGEFRAFFSGDSEVEELTWFLANGAVPDVTLLKAAHHGSSNGYTPAFLRRVRPEVVAISSGAGNSYGHPHREALTAYQEAAREVLRTDRLGEFTVLGYENGRYAVIGAPTPGGAGSGPRRPEQTQGPPPVASGARVPLSLGVFADAPGNDHQNRNGEYVVVTNDSGAPLGIGGWAVCDAVGACFTFPASAVLPARGQVVVYTGSGRSDGRRFYMGWGRAVWNNDGDTATLYDATGAPVARHSYE